MASSETTNFYRVVSLIVDAGAEVLRSLFLKYACPPSVTSPAAVNPKHTIYNYLYAQQLTVLSLKNVSKKQLDLIFPSSKTETDIETWDITLLYTILRNVCKIPTNEQTECDNLRMKRNDMYAHSRQANLTDSDFQTYWTDIRNIIINLAQFTNDPNAVQHVTSVMNIIKTGPVDIGSAIEVFKAWYERDNVIDMKLDATLMMLEDQSKVADDRDKDVKTSFKSIDTKLDQQVNTTAETLSGVRGE